MTPEAELLTGSAWALLPETLAGLGERSLVWASHPTAVQNRPARFQDRFGRVSVIPIRGIITHRESLRQQIFGGTSIETLTQQFRQALSDRNTLGIVFDVDSPGGEATGIQELADEIFRSRAKKKTIAVANGCALAGAYWLASAAEELVVTQSGQVGSIGVVAQHENLSGAFGKAGVRITLISAGKFKTDGNSAEPLSDSARAHMQRTVNAIHGKFISDVARGRNESIERVRNRFGRGRSVLASMALGMGMVDKIATLDQTIARFASGREEPKRASASQMTRPSAGVPLSLLRRELEALDGI